MIDRDKITIAIDFGRRTRFCLGGVKLVYIAGNYLSVNSNSTGRYRSQSPITFKV
ncbi:hypothetical protein SERLA73DRAFT_125940 [Serpula lacrymans var. lacrymans S7.3]|uniref:Uncharacterized protein n=2 Tax=Serpula lacrymans var. lacrymans TaxID=341189 RepID=F8QB49_SERL3|nr:uncharacterized protein SERLADRAFT_373983 [Serpula lacrymans var. lacrymans S7.9]EGN94435.1 hypothetical protein SERLA73DRAFT_125940 [Serpula lacrymans var. lacrymans S7.3]EGO19922.1 hypothetical protein SERLADRAFT_373983 [Serpula lacrymans var. lacrymans S7.9]